VPARRGRRPARRFLPFGLHQTVELFLAIALIVVGLHVTTPSEYFLVAGGSLLVLMVVLTEGPLSAWELMGRRSHRRADWVAIGALALMPAVPGRTLLSAVLLEAGALGLWRLSTWTRFEPPRPRSARARPAGPAVGTGLAPEVDLAVRRTARKAGIAAGVIRRRRMRS
jgi:hypothetical protein